jgi:hypothetical protein
VYLFNVNPNPHGMWRCDECGAGSGVLVQLGECGTAMGGSATFGACPACLRRAYLLALQEPDRANVYADFLLDEGFPEAAAALRKAFPLGVV